MMIELVGLMVLVVLLSIAVYHVAQLSTKETPFEEALAEQRQKSDLDISPLKNDKMHKKAKVKKLKLKKDDRLQSSSKASRNEIAPVHRPLRTKGKESIFKESKLEGQVKESKDSNMEVKLKGSPKEPKSEGQQLFKAGNKEFKAEGPLKGNKEPKESQLKGGKDVKEGQQKGNKDFQEWQQQKGSKDAKDGQQHKGSKDVKEGQQQKGSKDVKDVQQQKGTKDPKLGQLKGIKEFNETKEKAKPSPGQQQLINPKSTSPGSPTSGKSKKEDTSPKQMEKKDKKKKEGKEENSEVNKEKKEGDNKEKKKGIKVAKSNIKDQKSLEEEDKKSSKKNEDGREGRNADIQQKQQQQQQPKKQTEHAKVEKKAQPLPPRGTNNEGDGKKASSSPKGTPKPNSPQKTPPSPKESKASAETPTSQTPKKEKSKVNSPSQTNKLEKEQMVIVESQMQLTDKKKKREKEERKKLISLSDDALSRLLPIIQKSQLSGGEIQMLIETLLNKQQLTGGAGGEWVAKGKVDPVMQLKRQLVETEARLKEKEDAHETLSAKIADLRADLNTERGRSNGLKKQLDNSSIVMQQKLDVAATSHKDQLVSQVNEVKATLNKEYHAKMVQYQQTSKKDHESKLQQVQNSLSEVEKQLQQSKTAQQESETQYQQLKTSLADAEQQLQAGVKERDELMQTRQQHLSTLKDESDEQMSALNARLCEVQQKLSASESAHSDALLKLTKVANEKELLHQQINNLENVRELLSQNQVKLKKVLLEKSELESRLSQTEKELDSHRDLVKKQLSEMELLKEEKESLASQSVRPAAEGQENGDVHFEPKETGSQNHLGAIHEEQLSALTKEISKLKEESSHLRRNCDEERERREQTSRSTKALLRRIFPALKPGAESLDDVAFLQEVETASASVKAQPPIVEVKTEIVEKIVEKIVQDPQLCQQLEDIKKDNSDLHKKLEALTEQKASLEATLKTSSAAEERKTSQITNLELENKNLAEKIVNYQDILANTESLLKSLQKSVESEESSWHEKLLHQEELMRQVTADNKSLSLQVSELQTSLDKVKQAEEAAAHLCDLQFAYNCMEKSLPSILSQMESQLNCLKEKLNKEEEAKDKIQEQLNKVQEELNAANTAQVSTNGPANGVDCHEDEISRADTSSLVSSEGHSTYSQTDDTNKKKKKKKNFFLKLIRKSTNTEGSNVRIDE